MYLALKSTVAFKSAQRRSGLKINITPVTPCNSLENNVDKQAE